jgi:hypothetical protein
MMVIELHQPTPSQLCLRARPGRWALAFTLAAWAGLSLAAPKLIAATGPGFGLVVVFLGTILAIAPCRGGWSRCSLDRDSGLITLERPFSLTKRRRQYRFDEVERLALRQSWDPWDSSQGVPAELQGVEATLMLMLILKNGREVCVVWPMYTGSRGLRLLRSLEDFRKGVAPNQRSVPGSCLSESESDLSPSFGPTRQARQTFRAGQARAPRR